MDFLQSVVRRFVKGPKDVVGLDLGTTAIKAVRLRREKEAIHLVAADLLPGVNDSEETASIAIPRDVRASYSVLALPGSQAVVKLINIPGRFSDKDQQSLPANLGLAKDDTHRVNYTIITEAQGRGESRVLAAAMPEDDVKTALGHFPIGRPAPHAVVLGGLAALSGYAAGPGVALTDQTVGVMDGGETRTTFAIFNKGIPVLVRRFDFGEETVIAKVGEKLGVDAKTAQGFMSDGSFDISAILTQSLEVFFKQIVISKEFVERRENCRVSEILISGGLSMARGVDEAIKSFLGTEVRKWNPFSGLVATSGAVPEALAGQEGRFAAAFGAAISVL